ASAESHVLLRHRRQYKSCSLLGWSSCTLLLKVFFCFDFTLRCAGQRKAENGPAFRIFLGPKPAMVGFYDRTTDVQPHPQPLRFGAVERLEQALWIVEAVTTIDHGDFQRGVLARNID